MRSGGVVSLLFAVCLSSAYCFTFKWTCYCFKPRRIVVTRGRRREEAQWRRFIEDHRALIAELCQLALMYKHLNANMC